MQLQQQDKPLKQQVQTIIRQNGALSFDLPLEKLPETLNDPQALVWLDIQGEYNPTESLLRGVFKLQHIPIQTMVGKHEGTKFAEKDKYDFLGFPGLIFHSTM